jgi:sigma-B regulation protein RsbU (phosphoserine phosphatase)
MTGRTATAVPADTIDHLALVAEMSRDFAESQDIDATLQRGLERIAHTLDAEAASLFVLEDGTLVCRGCFGPVDIAGLRLAPDAGIVGRAVQSGHSQIVRDAAKDPDFADNVDEQTGFTTRSILCAPLGVRDQLLGAIELINKRGGRLFDDRDRRLLEALAASAALALINARLAAEMVAREGLRREIELAASIQRSFLPADCPDDHPVHGINWPARQVSGDFYDIVARPDGRLWFNVGDVSGKGVNASLLMAKTASLFRYLAKAADDPAAVLASINRELHETATQGMFVTMTCGIYDPESGVARLANAGHEPALLYAAGDGGKADVDECVRAHAPPLGILPELDFEHDEDAAGIVLKGRRLYLFTDGLTEARRPDGEPWGQDGIADLIRTVEGENLPPGERIRRIVEQVAPCGGAPADDLTLVMVQGPDA